MITNDLIHTLSLHIKWHLIDMFHVEWFDNSLRCNITELSQFILDSLTSRLFCTNNQHIWLDTQTTQFLNRVLRWFCLHFTSSLQIRKKRCVDIHNVVRTNISLHLTKCFKEWETFNIPNRTTNFSDNDIWISRCRCTLNLVFQSICDMRNHLNSRTKILPFTFLTQNFAVNLTSSHVRVFIKIDINKTFVVTKVKVSFSTIISNINFTVLVRTHCPWVNIDVRIEFLNRNLKTTILKQTSKTCSYNPFTNWRYHTTSDENIFCHVNSL